MQISKDGHLLVVTGAWPGIDRYRLLSYPETIWLRKESPDSEGQADNKEYCGGDTKRAQEKYSLNCPDLEHFWLQ
ncbi:hypothetical protein [Microbulbifer spongiae]|uniref:NTR domain-containing protein n=1 Tax=Microbulbifer spongiae TaxID=2944933 RepID=A0ABY9EEB6_9GAMM|nr:hypothetical protein [Microbulbifer sp. MI-G]WKD49859.1 hypothetical protein M8T91_00070 [Microbulbifer sp. MI-G]